MRALPLIAGVFAASMIATTPAVAGIVPVPEPEVAGGFAALVIGALVYRLVKARAARR